MIAKTKTIGKVKYLLPHRPLEEAPAPSIVYLAVEHTRAPKGDVFVKEGDHVNFCQKVGMRHGPFFEQPIFSTVSGTVLGIEKHCLYSGKQVNFIKIQNDFKDTLDPAAVERTPEEVNALTKDELVKLAADFALVGLGGSGFPTSVKLATKEPIKHILINGIECEPYLSADQLFMMNYAEDMIHGTALLMKMYDCHDARICVKAIHPEIIEHLNAEIERLYPGSGMVVAPMKNFYPQGWEVSMIKTALGIEVKPGTLPPQYGIMNVNVATAASLYWAARFNRPTVERYVSFNGDGIAEPKDFLVRLGTPVTDLIPLVGGYTEESGLRMVVGGPMMGIAVPNDDVIITETVTSFLIMKEHGKTEAPCIRCGSCVLSCPAHLEPVLIMEAVKSNDRDRIKALKPLTCVECGLCTYSCTSGIRVTDFIRRAKLLAKL